MDRRWIFGTAFVALILLIAILVATDTFDAWAFGGMVFYILLFAGGYAFIIYGHRMEQKRLAEETRRKQKFDWCWDRANQILRRMAGGQGLSWSRGFGRRSEYRTFHDGVQSHPYRSMLGDLSNSKQPALVIYDIDRDDIVRFVANPPTELLENHFKHFRPFSKGIGANMEDYDYPGGMRGMYSRRYQGQQPPVSIQMGGNQGRMSARDMEEPKPDDDMIDSAVETIKENNK